MPPKYASLIFSTSFGRFFMYVLAVSTVVPLLVVAVRLLGR